MCVDIYGDGPDLAAIQADAAARGLPLVFKGQADHCSPALQEYRVSGWYRASYRCRYAYILLPAVSVAAPVLPVHDVRKTKAGRSKEGVCCMGCWCCSMLVVLLVHPVHAVDCTSATAINARPVVSSAVADALCCQIFINCCKKDVLATATAEAVAMNKWVVLPDVPCNEFFRPFPNVLLFRGAAGFSCALMKALEHDPPPLSLQHLR